MKCFKSLATKPSAASSILSFIHTQVPLSIFLNMPKTDARTFESLDFFCQLSSAF